MAIGLDLSIGSGGDGGGSGGALATGILQLQGGVPLDTTLRNVADQADTLSPLQLSTTQVGIAPSSYSNTSGTVGGFITTQTFAAGAGSALFRPINIAYTINNSGAQSGTATGIFLNATETALNGMTHNLMDLQVGGTSQFKVSNTGLVIATNGITGTLFSHPSRGSIRWYSGDGVMTLMNNGETGFDRLNFGGLTNAFPAIKRNGAAIDFRLADDSGYAAINSGNIVSGDIFADGDVRVKYTSSLYWDSRSVIQSPSNGLLSLLNNAGTDFSKLHFGGTTKPAVCQGKGTPEGAVTAPVGSVFMRSDGGALTSFYVKQTGTGNTGWLAIA